MEKRQLGRTGHMSTVAIFGAAAFWEIDQASANTALDLAHQAGVNHIDVAPQYGQGEIRVGGWLPPHRDEFFLGCKTLERSRDDAWAELHRSLEKLQTESLDLYQLHAVTDMDELNKAMGPDGAIQALQRAKDEGLTQYLGITGHGLQMPSVALSALERFDFDTVMFPVNPVLWANNAYRAEAEKLLTICQERSVGVMVIKSIAKGPWADRDNATYNTWYEPYDQQAAITDGVHFALSQPGVTGIATAGDTTLLPMVLNAAGSFTPMPAEQQTELINRAQQLEPLFT